MTAQEAIKRLQYERPAREYHSNLNEVFDMAIEALEKQIPKKPLYKQGTRYKWIDSILERGRYHNVEKWSNRDACPNCKKDILQTNYCEKCGQKLDWGDYK